MNKTKIDWADMTWNAVTGCLHDCEYCYARRIADRFGAHLAPLSGKNHVELAEQDWFMLGDQKIRRSPYPFDFTPTLHRYRLDEPARENKPQTIFVCSMADLFGDWVPDRWIKEVFAACERAPQHRYLFLTKNPKRYHISKRLDMLPAGDNFWFGFTATNQRQLEVQNQSCGWMDYNTFASIEPIHEAINIRAENRIRWVIVGAETGNRKGKVAPRREWIEEIAESCREAGVPLFMKESLRGLMGSDFMQEFPWDGGVKDA